MLGALTPSSREGNDLVRHSVLPPLSASASSSLGPSKVDGAWNGELEFEETEASVFSTLSRAARRKSQMLTPMRGARER